VLPLFVVVLVVVVDVGKLPSPVHLGPRISMCFFFVKYNLGLAD
jgi:hypothetical protein